MSICIAYVRHPALSVDGLELNYHLIPDVILRADEALRALFPPGNLLFSTIDTFVGSQQTELVVHIELGSPSVLPLIGSKIQELLTLINRPALSRLLLTDPASAAKDPELQQVYLNAQRADRAFFADPIEGISNLPDQFFQAVGAWLRRVSKLHRIKVKIEEPSLLCWCYFAASIGRMVEVNARFISGDLIGCGQALRRSRELRAQGNRQRDIELAPIVLSEAVRKGSIHSLIVRGLMHQYYLTPELRLQAPELQIIELGLKDFDEVTKENPLYAIDTLLAKGKHESLELATSTGQELISIALNLGNAKMIIPDGITKLTGNQIMEWVQLLNGQYPLIGKDEFRRLSWSWFNGLTLASPTAAPN